MSQTVIGLFNSASEAQQAVTKLINANFVKSNVDVAAQDARQAKHLMQHANRTTNEDEDGISRFFNNLFGSDNDDAVTYANATRNGGSVVTVHAMNADEAARARDIMDECNAIDVHAEQEGMANTGAQHNPQGAQKLNIIEEKLQVGKRVEQTGGARIRSRIIEKPVAESIRLREEHLNVQRRDVDRPATQADMAAFKEGEIQVTESAERAVVSKEARVVGEVSIDKTTTEHEQTVRDTVRSTDVQVEQLEGSTRNK